MKSTKRIATQWSSSLKLLFLFSVIKLTFAGFACLKNPCAFGICIDDIHSPHQCYCQNGFTGYSCEQNWDECQTWGDSPCRNGGTCIDGIASFNCSCPEPFAGRLCEINLSRCELVFPCANNGTCVYSANSTRADGLMCSCQLGFAGERCEEDVSMCNATATNPCFNGGKCVDGFGNKFHCQCEPGWAGSRCERNIDECASSPCLNGGVCVDELADFSCACPFGYTGKTCETKLKICDENPCQNNALCLEESGNKVCYCVPDFHGELCEERYNECHPPNKCDNGGTCIDGVGTFTCSCPPGFFGSLCQCSPDNVTSPECAPVAPETPDPTSGVLSTSYAFPVTISADGTSVITTLYVEASSPVVYPPSLGVITSADLESSESTPSLKLTPVMPTPVISDFVEPSAEVEDSAKYDPCPSISLGDIEMTPSATLGPSMGIETSSTVFVAPSLGPTPEVSEMSRSSVYEASSLDNVEPERSTPVMPGMSSEAVTLDVSSVFGAEQTIGGSKFVSPVSTPIGAEQTPGPSQAASVEPTPTGIYLPASSSTEEYDNSELLTPTPIPPTTIVTSVLDPAMDSSAQLSSPAASEFIVASTPSPLDLATPVPTPITPATSTEPLEARTDEVTPEIVISTSPPTTGNMTDPCENYCTNGGTCAFISIQPVCLCPFRFVGDRCEQVQPEVQVPAFAGESFLRFEVPRVSRNLIHLSVQMATIAKDGVLAYSTIGKIYAVLYIQNGLLGLHFSCGSQTMHFLETRTRIDNGYNFTVDFRLENTVREPDQLWCLSQVSLNASYTMKGEQLVDKNVLLFLDQPTKTIYLGGIDKSRFYSIEDDVIRILPGFKGCVYSLTVNEELVSMFNEAKDGREISECSTFACTINPCLSGSRCVAAPKYPFWSCMCPQGYEGLRCNIRACEHNPCKNGATCTQSHQLESLPGYLAANSTSKCLCPLGFGGPLCQSKLNVTTPSFRPTHDYSSYIAFEMIPRFEDWMQLKFHFITPNISQIALLLYVGTSAAPLAQTRVQANASEERALQDSDSNSLSLEQLQLSEGEPKDFFYVSFLQGYIALTWNLGSGTQRITSPSRIDNRLNVHTVFAGRNGRQAWLKVDGMRNITGKSPGQMYQLNSDTTLMYVGGHEIPLLEGLPHDVSLHSGYQGCLFDLGFRVKNKLFLPRPRKGRNVHNCYEDW